MVVCNHSHLCGLFYVAQRIFQLHTSVYSGGWLHVCMWQQCGFPIGGRKQEVISASNLQKAILLYIYTFLKYCMDTTKVHWENFLKGH